MLSGSSVDADAKYDETQDGGHFDCAKVELDFTIEINRQEVQ